MEEEEFDLSKKIEILEAKFNDLLLRFTGSYYPHLIDSDENAGEEIRQMIWDINKEFIRRLKRKAKLKYGLRGFLEDLDKLAGEELSGDKLT